MVVIQENKTRFSLRDIHTETCETSEICDPMKQEPPIHRNSRRKLDVVLLAESNLDNKCLVVVFGEIAIVCKNVVRRWLTRDFSVRSY